MPTKVFHTKDWKDAIDETPPEGVAIAFVIHGHPFPVSGYFERNKFYQVVWDNAQMRTVHSPINREVDKWRLLQIGTEQEAKSCFSVLVGDK